jgi:hypothetical protein
VLWAIRSKNSKVRHGKPFSPVWTSHRFSGSAIHITMTGSYQDMALAISQALLNQWRLQPPSFADRVFVSMVSGALSW